MFRKIICTVIILITLNSVNSRLTIVEDFMREQNQQSNSDNQHSISLGRDEDDNLHRADLQAIRADFQSLRSEMELLKQAELHKQSDIQLLRVDFQSLRAELTGKQQSLNQSSQSEQDKDVQIQNLKTQLEYQKKLNFDNEKKIEFLTSKLERQTKNIDKLESKSKLPKFSESKSSGPFDVFFRSSFDISSESTRTNEAVSRDAEWIVILRRLDGSVDFYRNWTEYKNGFGNRDGEFFLGLDKIHTLTTEKKQELMVVLEDFHGNEKFETYAEFAIGDEYDQYEIQALGSANGTAGDSLTYHKYMRFSTFDHDNSETSKNCAEDFTGAWWYKHCYLSNLAGNYSENSEKGIGWATFPNNKYYFKRAIMMLRPTK